MQIRGSVIPLVIIAGLMTGCTPGDSTSTSASTTSATSTVTGPNYARLSASEKNLWQSLYAQSAKSAPSTDSNIPPFFSRDFVTLNAQASPEADFQESLQAWKVNSFNVLLHAGGAGSTVLLQKYLFILALSANTATHTITTYAQPLNSPSSQTPYVYSPTQLQLQFRSPDDGSVPACFQNVNQTFNIQGDSIISVTYHYTCTAGILPDYTDTYIPPIPVPSILRSTRLSPSGASVSAVQPISAAPQMTPEAPLGKTPVVVVSPAPPALYIPLTSLAGQVALHGDEQMTRAQHSPTEKDLLHPHLANAVTQP